MSRSHKTHDGDDAEATEEYGKLPEQYAQEYWSLYSGDDPPNILKREHLRIAPDGGMGDVKKLQVKYSKAAFILSFGVFNCMLVLRTDIAALGGDGPPTYHGHDDFLMCKWLFNTFLDSWEREVALRPLGGDFSKLVPLLELVFMSAFLLQTLVYIVLAISAPFAYKDGGAFQQWSCTSYLFWTCIPRLVHCSALRMLHFVSPVVLTTDAYIVSLQAYEVAKTGRTVSHYAHSIFMLAVFVFSRGFALLLGLDAFLVKFRLASGTIDSGRSDYLSNLAAITFVWQVVGIICLDWVIKDRLFIFMFGGEDGKLDIDDAARMEVWKSLVCRKIVERFGLWKGSIVMLSFNDYDLQMLVLEDDADLHRFTERNDKLTVGNRIGSPRSSLTPR
jgi:hypothetical protein